ncbi:MAG: hypothetical protein ACI4D4_00230 [Lachnospira sp.]
MKEGKNELMQFVAGVVMLVVGLFIFSQRVHVFSTWGYGWYLGGLNLSSGIIIIPLIAGIIWMFATNSFASKVFSAIATLLIIVSVILTTHIRLSSMTLFEWILIIVLIFGGLGLVAKILFASNKSSDKKNNREFDTDIKSSVDEELERMKKK